MPRFVLLRHETPAGYPRLSHFDLMLQCGQRLRTWACPAVPAPGQRLLAEQLADHRRDYLDYEGAVSGGRGSVTRVAAGQYETLEETADLLRVRLTGDLSGELTLVRERVQSEPQRWWVSLSSG